MKLRSGLCTATPKSNGEVEAKILVLHTGGTIGMMRNKNNVLVPQRKEFERRIQLYPNLHDKAYANEHYGGQTALVLPAVDGINRRIVYQINEYQTLLDSSDIGVKDWVHIATDIQREYNNFNGFVVLHGTDTLAYTASALSFMFENLDKPVILTGSQIPIFETRSDGRDNLISALILASDCQIKEVCVFFSNRLLRGNRTVKTSCESFDAFDSPNTGRLAMLGVNMRINYSAIRRTTGANFSVQLDMEEHVDLLRICPSISEATVKSFLKHPMRGLVLQTYGAGNIPATQGNLMEALHEASKRMLIVNCTQCCEGAVCGLYNTGDQLQRIGVLPGYDMTAEAAVAKLSFVLGKKSWDWNTKKQMMITDLRGELTPQ